MAAKLILGIDPGIARMGYGLVEVDGNRMRPVAFGCIETFPDSPMPNRLGTIYDELTKIITAHRPAVMAIEELFFYKNVTTAFVVGQARGVAILTGVQANMELAEYTPMEVKLAVTGYGKADKRQVQDMVRVLLNLAERPKPDDTADALAIAITHAHASPMLDVFKSQKNLPDSRRTVRYERNVRS
jgi:crossover junction endodeoxyribonuclease RuvC